MPDRDAMLTAFADRAGWGEALRIPLAGDASNRRYVRLRTAGGDAAVVMDAPPGTGEDVRPFLAIAQHLSALGLSAPRLVAADETNGFLLLEDLGDGLFSTLVEGDPTLERPLYLAAAEALAALHRAPPPPDLMRFTADVMADLARLVFEWYAPRTGAQAAENAVAHLRDALARAAGEPTVLALRDFHAGNLIWLPERDGPRRVGLLDFQDAVVAHPAYDLVSLIDDARRDVSTATRVAVVRHFLDLTGHEEARFAAAAAALSVQRNLRILGVFARLAGRDGKTGYLRFLPRVWRHLQRNLDHPALSDLRRALDGVLSPPEGIAAEAACPGR